MKKNSLVFLVLLFGGLVNAYAYDLTKGITEHGTIAFTDADNDTISTAEEGDVVTVTLTPDNGYVVKGSNGFWSITWEAADSRRLTPNPLQEIELIPVEGTDNQWTFTMKGAHATVNATYKKLLSNTDITINDVEEVTYTGEERKPTFVVKDGETELKEGTDYEVSYKNNVNAALSTIKDAPSYTITALATSEEYAGDTTLTFTILKAAGSISYEVTRLDKKQKETFTNPLTVVGDGKITYSISGSIVATVNSETGQVTITDAPGAFTITATVEDGANYAYETKTASYVVSAALPIPSDPSINKDDEPTVAAGKLALLTVLNKAKEVDLTEIELMLAVALEKAIDNAETTLKKEDVTIEELDAARIALLKALDELEKKTTTGLSGMSGKSGMSGDWYDLQGRKVQKSAKTKGLYIIKGKKVMVR